MWVGAGPDGEWGATVGILWLGEGDGDVVARFEKVTVSGSDDEGIQIEAEKGEGQVHVTFRASTARDNRKAGLRITQENAGAPGTVRLIESIFDKVKLKHVETL